MRAYSPDESISVFAERLKLVRNTEIVRTIFHLIGSTLGEKGAELVRNNWQEFAFADAFSGIAFAASRCLALEEAHARVTHVLSGMDLRKRCESKHVLHWFETPLNLDWIETNVASPVDITWGSPAASSGFDWQRARKWLSMGRPLSLVALDALDWCISSGRKPPLANAPTSSEFISVLEDYLSKDNVRRVRERVHKLLEFNQGPTGSTTR